MSDPLRRPAVALARGARGETGLWWPVLSAVILGAIAIGLFAGGETIWGIVMGTFALVALVTIPFRRQMNERIAAVRATKR